MVIDPNDIVIMTTVIILIVDPYSALNSLNFLYIVGHTRRALCLNFWAKSPARWEDGDQRNQYEHWIHTKSLANDHCGI